jgi:uncharacterized membrane protein YccF (DUF307 family)
MLFMLTGIWMRAHLCRYATKPLTRIVLALCFASASFAHANSSFVPFGTGQVRPLAMSPDGNRLFAVNTPDNRLEIFTLTEDGPVQRGSSRSSATSRAAWR